jgi:hypothetical protein
VIKPYHGCKCDEKVNVLFEVIWDHSLSNEELRSSLRVTNICINLLNLSVLFDEIDKSRLIIDTHLFEIKVPKLFLGRVHADVSHGIFGSTIIAHPHIISSPYKLESDGLIRAIDDPGNTGVGDTVLQHHNRSFATFVVVRGSRIGGQDSIKTENVAILGGDVEVLVSESIF